MTNDCQKYRIDIYKRKIDVIFEIILNLNPYFRHFTTLLGVKNVFYFYWINCDTFDQLKEMNIYL